ncbi:4Fe-4S binding protein [Thiohalobacter thiocyanaticus]|uniref:4Fe-4S binding protein n=1 Tax=Thiohalobacter thiocyanaticus TaxID=585455 RepID=A0A426QIZ4_9GAMM|nr:4Fe-4S binding protein [Thiohalobacter thiocyanaticus]RRQ21734.1 4Fe-4S binding protein [Thiohalobacter thiocyanaticus]
MKPLLSRTNYQRRRALTQVGFFVLFILAPPLDIFRFDLTLGHFILFGQPWTLGIDEFREGLIGPGQAALNLILRGFVPLFGGAALFIWIAWRWGRLYCGWLCPHYSVVELVNGLMRRASGRPNLYEKRKLPEWLPNGTRISPNSRYWPPTLITAVAFAFIWALTLLTYLLPPQEIYHNLLHAELTRNQFIFLTAATIVLSIEFIFARHLFCRFGCAVGLFQSLAWMGNNRAMVVGFDTRRAKSCQDCNNACDNACPMRLNPRTIKRKMFTCTQCAECISACTQVQAPKGQPSLLQWVSDEAALPVVTGRPVKTRPAPGQMPPPDRVEADSCCCGSGACGG